MVALLGCAPSVPLADVPIRRGTAEQREAVEQALADFELQTGGGRVEIRKIVFARGDYGGQYNSASRVIHVHEEIPVDLVPKVVRHELCHALDFQEDLLARKGSPIDAWVDVLLDEEAGLVEERIHRPRRRRSEAFALWCGEGPLHAALLSESCSDEPLEVTEVAAWLTEVVWTGYALPTIEETPAPTPSWTALFEPVAVYASATADPSVISLSLVAAAEGGGSEHQWAYLDLHSGAWLPPIPGILGVSDYEPLPMDLGDLHVYNSVMAPSGEFGARVGIDFFLGEHPTRRALYWNGETLFDAGCILDVFGAEDRIWGVWTEGAVVHWSPLGD